MTGTAQFLGLLTQGVLAAAVLAALLGALPWALWHYIGWPLPTQVPTSAQLQALLLGPMTTQFLLDVLACLCWITWAAFTIDVARCAVDAARGAHWPNVAATGPVHTVAAVLVGAIMLSILAYRSAPPPQTAPPTMTGAGTALIATVAARHPEETTVRTAALATAAQPESVVVQSARGGVHDSLWRIAERTLGDGRRWPEIFELNRGKPQPDGGMFTTPSLIFPGEELALPPGASPPQVTAAPPQTRQPVPLVALSPTSPAPPPSSSAPASSATLPPSTRHTPPTAGTTHSAPTNPDTEPGLRWGPVLFLGLGLATAVSA
ncbi:MAG: LysM peptidoglycan-binding domain-containing protein, partial [Actinomycetes bacterium]